MDKRRKKEDQLLKELEELKPHDHLCLIYESNAEWEAAIIPFIRIGLERKEKCIYVADTRTADELRDYLNKGGVEAAPFEASGQLTILRESDVFTKGDSFDPDRIIRLLITETEKAVSQGYPALRLTGEMTFVLKGVTGSERLLEYETKLNRDLFSKYPCLAICQYDRWKFNPEIIKGIIMTHPKLIHGGRVSPNFYYIPTEEFLNHKRSELEAHHWLNNITREEKRGKELVDSETRYRRLFEAAKDGILIINAESGKISNINPYLLDLMCYSKEEVLGKQVWQLGFLKDKLRNQDSFRKLQKTGYVHYEDLPLETKDGQSIAVEFISNTYRVNGDEKIQCNIRDITQRKQAEHELKESETLINKVGDIALVGGWEMDIITRKAKWTKTAYDIVEIDYNASLPSLDEYISYYLPQYQPVIEDAMERLINQGDTLDFEAELKTAKGNIKWCRAIGQQAEVVNGRCVKIIGTFQDITQRKETERELELRAELLDNAVDSIFLVTLDGKFIYVNEAASHSLGYSKDELLKLNLSDISAPEVDIETQWKQILDKGQAVFESAQLCKDGSVIPVEVHIRIIEIRNDRLALSVTHDITGRKAAEAFLKESEERYRTFIESTHELIQSVGMDGKLRFVNRAWHNALGYSEEDLKNLTLFDIIHPDSLDHFTGIFQEVLNGRSVSGIEAKFKAKDGSVIDVEGDAAPRYLGDKIIATQGFFRDITERKKVEASLRNSEEKYRSLVNHVRMGIIRTTLGTPGTILEANPAMEEITGYSKKELVKMDITNLYFNPRDRDKLIKDLASSDDAIIREQIWRKKDDSLISIMQKITSVKDSNGKTSYLDSTIDDITERKLAEEEIVKSHATLKKTLNDAINTMAKIVEMRDPYTAGHQQRVAKLAIAIAKELNFNESQIEQLWMAATVHDIGKIYVPSDILNKPGKISELEFSIIKTHSQGGYDIMKEMEFPSVIAQSILQHHERLNGSGYPNGLMGEDIIIEAKIIAVADVVEAMASHRPYRPTLGIYKALEEIANNKGVLYDSKIANVCVRLFKEKRFDFE